MMLDEYRTHRRRTTNHDLSRDQQRLNAALGLGESGELQNIVKKEIYHGHPESSGAILDEVGDMLFYIDWLLDAYGWTMDDALTYNVQKLQKRYPYGFESEKSINRQD